MHLLFSTAFVEQKTKQSYFANNGNEIDRKLKSMRKLEEWHELLMAN